MGHRIKTPLLGLGSLLAAFRILGMVFALRTSWANVVG